MAQEIKKTEAGAMAPQRYMDPFTAMRAEMDRVFDTFLGSGFGRLQPMRREWTETMAPNMDVRETEAELVIEAELPGMDEKDVSVTLANGVLTMKGEKKVGAGREERRLSSHRTQLWRLPEVVPAW